jgi:hypothetical protein
MVYHNVVEFVTHSQQHVRLYKTVKFLQLIFNLKHLDIKYRYLMLLSVRLYQSYGVRKGQKDGAYKNVL